MNCSNEAPICRSDEFERRIKQNITNAATAILSNFIQKQERIGAVTGDNNNTDNNDNNDENLVLSKIDFNVPKIQKVPISALAAMTNADLHEKEWFVTGNANSMYFDDAILRSR